nr:gamma-glutamyl-gamma-aminobutyrate hydrolase family protein [Thermogutta sp.]
MRRKPLIGLNMDFGKVESKGYVAELPAGYFDCLIRAQAVPVAIPPLVHRRDIEQALDAVDGFVLIGGDDLDPLR